MKTAEQIAEDAFPEWSVVPEAERSPQMARPVAQYGTPDVADLRKRYGIGDDDEILGHDAAFVEMELTPGKGQEDRRVVIVSQGKVVAVQG